ncbi:hypothetical protein [Amycolatopsis solani]|uniref:hypothetical protein n=1 Tax=Amycolatopsis solani TaxID=3028615 RepID=UPI0025B03504|nr:hypothetical protein [Amycolatopsis sp. MEP2-6]
MKSWRSWLPPAALLWLPLLMLVGGSAVLATGIAMAADVHRSAGLFWGQVVEVGDPRDRSAAVEYTGPDGRTKRQTFELDRRRVPVGKRVQIRVWPDEGRAEFDAGDKYVTPIVYGGVVSLLGAAGTVVVFVRHNRIRRRR